MDRLYATRDGCILGNWMYSTGDHIVHTYRDISFDRCNEYKRMLHDLYERKYKSNWLLWS